MAADPLAAVDDRPILGRVAQGLSSLPHAAFRRGHGQPRPTHCRRYQAVRCQHPRHRRRPVRGHHNAGFLLDHTVGPLEHGTPRAIWSCPAYSRVSRLDCAPLRNCRDCHDALDWATAGCTQHRATAARGRFPRHIAASARERRADCPIAGRAGGANPTWQPLRRFAGQLDCDHVPTETPYFLHGRLQTSAGTT